MCDADIAADAFVGFFSNCRRAFAHATMVFIGLQIDAVGFGIAICIIATVETIFACAFCPFTVLGIFVFFTFHDFIAIAQRTYFVRIAIFERCPCVGNAGFNGVFRIRTTLRVGITDVTYAFDFFRIASVAAGLRIPAVVDAGIEIIFATFFDDACVDDIILAFGNIDRAFVTNTIRTAVTAFFRLVPGVIIAACQLILSVLCAAD